MANTVATVTVTIPADLAQNLRSACCYSASMWRDLADGECQDFDADSCLRLSRKAWELYDILGNQI
jgi:hypothetical protein